MSNVKYQNAAMEYAMWYQEHLLRMEDILGKRLEAKMEEMIDKKCHDYLVEVINKNNSNNNTL